MPNSHLLKNWVPVSALFHLTLLVLASMIPWTPHRPADVMIVDLADLPRSADFPTPRPPAREGVPRPPAEGGAPPDPREQRADPGSPHGGNVTDPRGDFRAVRARTAQVPSGDHPLPGEDGHRESKPRSGTGCGNVHRKRGRDGGEGRGEGGE